MAKSVGQIEGVIGAELNFASGTLLVEHVAGADPLPKVEVVVRSTGHGIEPLDGEPGAERPAQPGWWEHRRHEVAVGISAALMLLGWAAGAAHLPEWGSAVLYVAAAAVAGTVTVRRAVVSLRARMLDMNVLMTIAVIGAILIGEWAEAAMVIFLFALGGMLESRALERTRRSIRDLMDLAPPTVRVLRGGDTLEVPPAEVAVGETISIRPGERVALDGVVAAGASAVDESPVTGESVPADKGIGDTVYAGSLNTSGLLKVTVTAPASDTTLARIVHMVEEAQGSRAPVQTLVERFTRWYTPSVVVAAVALAVVPPLLAVALGADWGGFETWFYRALVLLVVSCPCALVVSTPVAIVSAISRATRDGVLVKGGAFLERAAAVRAVAFDKTGTLTRGRPEVSSVVPIAAAGAPEVLAAAAALEAHSTHPLAAAVVRAAGEALELPVPEGLVEEPGLGVRGVIGGVPYAVGSALLAEQLGALDEGTAAEVGVLEAEGRTALVVVREGAAFGVIGIADEMRAEAGRVVAALHAAGVEHTVMLTGDNERTAAAVARHAGVTGHMARLLPQDKVDAVRHLKDRYGVVAMVGDGINDAPALAASDIGIAMGAVGSDAALETADVALMADDLNALPGLFDLGRRTLANIRQNVTFSVAVKAVTLVAAVAGYAPLWLAVFADTGVALLVVLNGLRLLRAPSPRGTGARAA